jgi:hypothetical protein
MSTAQPMRWLRSVALLALVVAITGPVRAEGVGEAIYRHGALPSGGVVRATRNPGMQLTGEAAACVNCHRRSGLGMVEGHVSIPPIAGSYLFHPRASTADDLDLPFVAGMRADRDPYTDATLARAIRQGLGADGRPLDVLMPHYDLDDAQMSDLIAYLKYLSPGTVPGVTDSVLHFATIFTPDSDPVARQGVLNVLTRFFDDKNHYTRAQSPRLRSSKRMMFKVNRHWELHVWQLKGASDTWEAQLRSLFAAQPVFAVISGLGGHTWAPVQRFCEAEELPCLFPNVDLPVDDERDFDTVYFSKGVLLEAGLIAHTLRATDEKGSTHRLVQVYRLADIGAAAADRLRSLLDQDAWHIDDQRLADSAQHGALHAAIAAARPGDTLVLWLRPTDIAALGPVPAGVHAVFMSGRMGGLDDTPLPEAWRATTHMAYPFDTPQHRVVQVDYPLGWFRIRQIPVVAEQIQADTYLACIILSDTINHMVDTFVRDYLVERIEEMLEHRILTGYYPRLSLAPNQSFASKGGYIVHFVPGTKSGVVADGEWITP